MDNDITTKTDEGEIILYQPDDSISLEVKLENETVWLTQAQLCELFGKVKSTISYHINNIFKEGELNKKVVVRKIRTTTQHGAIKGKTQNDELTLYNLDVIISVGYRVHSQQGTLFRQWATKVLREYLLRGYAIQPQLQKVEYHLSREISEQNNRIHSLEMKVQNQQQQVDFLVNIHQQPKEQIFASGCVWDAWDYVSQLVRSADKRIILIDNFVDERVLSLLTKRKKDVAATIYTRHSENFLVDLKKHNEQYEKIEFIQIPHKVHDRFLIIDNDVYLLGTSIKDMGTSLCAITKLEIKSENIIKLVQS